MEFWKEHTKLRMILIAILFAAGLVLIFTGWGMTGKLAGLGWMLVGLVLLLVALAIYNKPFETTKRKK